MLSAPKQQQEGIWRPITGVDKVLNIKFTRTWYVTGAKRDLWEVEGDVTLKKGIFTKEVRHFKYQIDPETGRVIAYEG